MLSLIVAGWLGVAALSLPYAAGGIYLAVHKTDPRTVQATTWGEYWDSYKDDPKEKKRLQASMGGAAFLLFGLPLILILVAMSKSRSLHGDARWATTSEAQGAKAAARALSLARNLEGGLKCVWVMLSPGFSSGGCSAASRTIRRLRPRARQQQAVVFSW